MLALWRPSGGPALALHIALRIGRNGMFCTNAYPGNKRRQNTGKLLLSNLFINSIKNKLVIKDLL